jgi:hypothetical protein
MRRTHLTKLLLLWLALTSYTAEMNVIVTYPYAWADVSFVSDKPSWVVYSDYRPPAEYDCIIARSYVSEGDAWVRAERVMNKSLCKKGTYGE